MTREVAVIGGGLAGAAVAARLAQAGRDVVLLEREAGPHDKVCGEFLSFEAQDDLARLGIDLDALGAVPIRSVAVEARGRRVEAPLPFRALSLSRRVLDEALLLRAAAEGAEVRRGARATALRPDGAGWKIEVGDEAIRAEAVVLATGKHDLRGWRRPPGRQADLIGFKGFWRLADARGLDGTVELHLFPGGYAGFQAVEGGRANLCLVVRHGTLQALGGRWDALLPFMLDACPGLARRLAGAQPCSPKPLAVAAIPYGLVQERADGLWRVGDQAAVIPSFTGEGMSLALHGARLAAEGILAGGDADAFQRRLAADLRGQVRRSTLLSRALVVPAAQAAIGLALTPALMGWALRATRIPEAARERPAAARPVGAGALRQLGRLRTAARR